MAIIRNQAKQAWLQSLYQCDKIIICLFVLLNAKDDTEVALKQREGSALSIADKGFSSMSAFAFMNVLAADYGMI